MNTPLYRICLLLLAIVGCTCFSHAQVDCFYKALSVSRVQGQVFDPSGLPIPATVLSLKQGGKEMTRATTDDQGRFSIRNANGKYELHTEARGFAPAFAPINVGNDFEHAFHPGKLWLILSVGATEPCPSVTTSHKQFLQTLSDYRKQFRGITQTNATQK